MPGATENPVQNVSFASNGSQAHGYLATPPGGSGPGVVVIQEWWGLTSHIKAVADRLAADGFVALAPDLYGGPTTHDADEAGRLMGALPVERAARDLAGAVDYLLAHESVTSSTVGAVGFCMGGGFVLTLAAQQGSRVGAAAAFYPVNPEVPDLTGLTAPVQFHFGTKDDFTPPARADELVAAVQSASGTAPDVHTYPAGHAFYNDENAFGTFDPASAEQAWSSLLTFLRDRLA